MRAGDPGFPSLYINADDIAREKKIGPRDAAVEAARQRAEAVARRKSCATETVMPTLEKIDFLEDAKRAGYEIALLYITTQSRKINLKRIQISRPPCQIDQVSGSPALSNGSSFSLSQRAPFRRAFCRSLSGNSYF
jgi:hypothetical protein